MATTPYEKALSLIDEAHSQDPNKAPDQTPYELHYARKMTHYLSLRHPSPSQLLSLAIRGQHFRRWEVPRNTFPMTKAGYLSWRTMLKKRQAEQVESLLRSCGFSDEDVERVGQLLRKEGLKSDGAVGGEEDDVQILEDVAALVFLDDQLEEFERGEVGKDEEKMVGILRKTWKKMSPRGRELALGIQMTERCQALVKKALEE
ncbi:hypothetical protein F5884DRAFT_769199 [Xylogone sp. PMI_703]|nr:hypothetical protein F5884DRAFT_769199 [Xylogone sp. PMI_703]